MATERNQSSNRRGRDSDSDRSAEKPDAPTAGQKAAGNDESQESGGVSTSQANGSQIAAGNEELSRLLQDQINQAIQPVLDDFRHQLESAVQHEVEQVEGQAEEAISAEADSLTSRGENTASKADQGKDAVASKADQGKDAASSKADQGKDASQKADEAKGTATSQSDQAQSDTPKQPPAVGDASSRSEGKDQAGDGDDENRVQGLVKSVRPTIGSAVGLVEQQAEQLLQSLLTAGVAALLSDATRNTIEHGAETGIQRVIEKTTAPLGDKASVRELRTQTETAIVAILQDTLDAIYAEEFQSKVREHVEATSRELVHRNLAAAAQHLGEVMQMVLQEVLAVLRTQWHRLLRVLLNVIMAALDDTPARGEGSTRSKSSTTRSTSTKKSDTGTSTSRTSNSTKKNKDD